MKPAHLVAALTVFVAAWFSLPAATVIGLGLCYVLTGRDPLWLTERGARWLRTELQILAGLAVDGWQEWMDRRDRRRMEEA